MRRVVIGLVGWGVVGGGVVELLARERALFAERCGLDLVLKRVVDRRPQRDRTGSLGATLASGCTASADIQTILADDEITVVVHLVGGTTVAKDLLLACLRAKKHVVTANKALIAEHGDELFAEANRHGVAIAFEAAVAGGIPVIAALRDGLVANRIQSICGILNGTCNFILTKMEAEHWGYGEALKEAQRLGYAEADPTLDVNGTDTAHKLAILARIAHAGGIPLDKIHIDGIERLSAEDIASAQRMGCRIKLLAVVKQQTGGLILRVAPTLVPLEHPLASVMRNFNGVSVTGSATGEVLLTGAGAGALPTASAVLSDVVDLCSGSYQATVDAFHFFTRGATPPLLPADEEVTGAYARFLVADRPGVLAGIASALSKHGASILSIHQGSPADGSAAIEVVTHPLRLGAMRAAVDEIDRSGLTRAATVLLRRL